MKAKGKHTQRIRPSPSMRHCLPYLALIASIAATDQGRARTAFAEKLQQQPKNVLLPVLP